MTLRSFLPTPIYNTPEIPFHRMPLKKDSQGLLREIETIAFPGTEFTCIQQISDTILHIETAGYPSPTPLFVDLRFLRPSSATPLQKGLPSSDEILQSLKNMMGTRYFWGGNWKEGIPEMLDFYPTLRTSSQDDLDDAICRGVDCSGFLYLATHGNTPRNTSDLIHFGEEVQDRLRPLDLLVWRGHMILVFDENTLIESRAGKGVVMSSLPDRHREALQITEAQNKQLFIRRWHPDFLPTIQAPLA